MSVEENKAMIKGFFEALNKSDWETEARPYLPDREMWNWFLPNHRAFRESFPDYHAEIKGIIGEGDRVAVWTEVSGTFSKPFSEGGMAGIEPKGQRLTWSESAIYDFVSGVPEVIFWSVDELGRLRQLGANV